MMSLIGNNSTSSSNQFEIDSIVTEKKNIINIFKLVVKDLIDISLKNNRHVDKQSEHLIYFFDVLENILNHGFKGRKGFGLNLLRNKDLSVLLDLIATKSDSAGCLNSIKDLNDIKTSIGRIRAWIRLSVMQKKLAENFQNLILEKDVLNEIYEKDSILASEEANIISGLLVGLNALDISIDLKSETPSLDQPIRSINYSIYLREKMPDAEEQTETENPSEQRINEIFDQKNFVEELNKKLELKSDQLSIKVQSLEKTNTSLSEKISILKVENLELKNEIEAKNLVISKIQDENKSKIESVYQDLQVERDTFNLSKNGLDQMFIDLQKKFYEEQKLKSNLESELQMLTTIKTEQETALKLLENEAKDKQEMVRILREQLEQVKSINLDLVNQVQSLESESKKFNGSIHDLKEQVSKLNNLNTELIKKLETSEQSLKKKEEICKLRLEQIEIFQKRTNDLESDLTIEKNWRIQLQNDLNEMNENLKKSNTRVQVLEKTEVDLTNSRQENGLLKNKIHELELTLEEMGSKLGTSHLKMQDIKEVTKQLTEFQWESDENVTSCKICVKDFNVARRKHHCRRCGGIFCNECSDNKMALPSSSKPVRVCNTCFDQILQKNLIK